MLITKQKAAKILGVSPAVFTHELKHDEIPAYFERDRDGEWRVNIESPAWRARVLSRAASGRKRADVKRSVAAKTKHAVRMLAEDNDDEVPDKIPRPSNGRYFRGALRQAIFKRDGFRCVRCGKTPADGITLEVDHVVEYEDGGKTEYSNGQTICSDCNKGKHSLKAASTGEYITQAEFARRVGAHRDTIADAINNGTLDYDETTGKINFSTQAVRWMRRRDGGGGSDDDPKMKKLAALALEAQMKKDIYQADSAKEKLEQDKLKTLEMKRELGPMGLITYWFSFTDNLIQRIHRRPNEIWPEIEALILGHESDKALLKIKRELEAVIIEARIDLKKSISDEGYDE